MRRMRWLEVSVPLFLCLAGRPAAAQPMNDPFFSGEDGTTRFVALRVSALSGLPDTFGLSIAYALHGWVAEGGISLFPYLHQGSSVYIRGGRMIPLVERPVRRQTPARDWSVDLLALGGVRLIVVDDVFGAAYTGTTGLEAVYWLGPDIGLDLQLTLGLAYGSYGLGPEGRLAAGIAF